MTRPIRDPREPTISYFELCRRQSVDAAAKAERDAAAHYAATEPQVDVDEPSPWDLFPNALRAIVAHSVYGSKKHNPGEPVHWAFGKSTGHVAKAIGHLMRHGETDPETGQLHEVNGAWRAVAALETALIQRGATPGVRVRGGEKKPLEAEPKPRQLHPAQQMAVEAFRSAQDRGEA